MKCGHLFNGIGGFALAASWMGWENIMHCEIDPFCNRVMNHHFPNSYQHEDIRTTDFAIWRGRIDLLTGGFPCQPYSTAGKRKGKADDRHLWPEMLRAIREISPRWIVGENVRGLTNWNRGVVFDEVQADLETQGYEVLPFLLPASGVGAPHRRDRIWFISYAAGNTCNHEPRNEGYEPQAVQEKRFDESFAAANTPIQRTQGCGANGQQEPRAPVEERLSGCNYPRNDWQDFPTQSPICSGNDGSPFGLADLTVPSRKHGQRILTGKRVYGRWRQESLMALGNAIVPQVAYQIFKAIEQYELTV